MIEMAKAIKLQIQACYLNKDAVKNLDILNKESNKLTWNKTTENIIARQLTYYFPYKMMNNTKAVLKVLNQSIKILENQPMDTPSEFVSKETLAWFYSRRGFCNSSTITSPENMNTKLLTKVINDCNKAISLNGNEIQAYFTKGEAYFKLEQFNEALIYFTETINRTKPIDNLHAVAMYYRILCFIYGSSEPFTLNFIRELYKKAISSDNERKKFFGEIFFTGKN